MCAHTSVRMWMLTSSILMHVSSQSCPKRMMTTRSSSRNMAWSTCMCVYTHTTRERKRERWAVRIELMQVVRHSYAYIHTILVSFHLPARTSHPLWRCCNRYDISTAAAPSHSLSLSSWGSPHTCKKHTVLVWMMMMMMMIYHYTDDDDDVYAPRKGRTKSLIGGRT